MTVRDPAPTAHQPGKQLIAGSTPPLGVTQLCVVDKCPAAVAAMLRDLSYNLNDELSSKGRWEKGDTAVRSVCWLWLRSALAPYVGG